MSMPSASTRSCSLAAVLFVATIGLLLVSLWHPFYPVPSEHIPQSRIDITLPKLAEHIRKKHPKLHIIPANNNSKDIEDGFYVSRRKMAFEEAARLVAHPSFLEHWRGVMLCRWVNSNPAVDNTKEQMDAWGENGLWFGRVTIVGDGTLIREILAP